MKNRAYAQPLFKQSVNQMEELDTIREEICGVFAYSQAGAVALAAGKLTQGAIPSANANNEALSSTQSAAIGAYEVTVTFGGAVTVDFYKDGYFWVNDAAGEGHRYRIKGHAAGTTDVTLYLKDPIRVALVASTSEWSAIENRQKLVLVCPTTLTGAPAGVPPIAVDINYYFWNQVKGPAAVLFHTGSSGAAAIGNQVVPANSNTPVPGAVEEADGGDIIPCVGTVLSVNVNTEYGLIALAIPGY